MEQQTISITKAGIQATLNARTSILAAANPIYGRYDRTKTLRQNVQISAPIMSRFDLFFIVLDEADAAADEAIATHIVNVHQKMHAALVATAEYSMERLQDYVRYAKTFKPVMTNEAQVRDVGRRPWARAHPPPPPQSPRPPSAAPRASRTTPPSSRPPRPPPPSPPITRTSAAHFSAAARCAAPPEKSIESTAQTSPTS